MFQFELHQHTGDICTEILVYEKGGVIKHVEATAINKVELLFSCLFQVPIRYSLYLRLLSWFFGGLQTLDYTLIFSISVPH